MTKDDFLKLLRYTSNVAHDFAKKYVVDELPMDFKYSVTLNASSDDLGLTQFDTYPNDDGKIVVFIEEKEVVELLCRKDKVPVWIDISVESVYEGKTIFRLFCAGRYSDDENEFYYNKNGTGFFGVKSPNLPIEYVEGKKFKLKAKKSIFSWLTKLIK